MGMFELKKDGAVFLSPRARFQWMLFTAMCVGAFCGCGEAAKPWEKVVPASGQITFEGKPAEGAQITLYPKAADFPASVRPSSTTGEGGKFVLGTHGAADGAPAGEYSASVVWFKVVDVGSGPVRGDNVLPAKYASETTSGLTIVINETETTIPVIDLKKR